MKKVKCVIDDLDGNYIVKQGKKFISDLQTWQVQDSELPEGIYNFDLDKKVSDLTDITPDLPDMENKTYFTLNIDASVLHRTLEFCIKDDLRPNMQHIYVYDGNIWATDAHGLIKIPLDTNQVADCPKDRLSAIIIPSHLVKLLPKKGQCIVQSVIQDDKDYQGTVIYHTDTATTYFAKAVANYPPDMAAVMPDKEDAIHSISIDTSKIDFKKHKAVKANYIKLTFESNICTLKSENIDMSLEYEDKVPCTYPYAEPVVMAFNLKFFERAVNKQKDTDILYFGTSKYESYRPAYINNTLLMPVNVN